jgi:hypothetical protein
MTLYQAIIAGRIALLLALAALCLRFAVTGKATARFRAVGMVVLIGALASYPNFGVLHPERSGYSAGAIHYYDTFHYFVGAKYFSELGYTGLYEATLVAAHDLGALKQIPGTRDLSDYTFRPASAMDAVAVRARFTPDRWRQFKEDIAYFGPRIDAWPELLTDRGYNDPPSRALLLQALVNRVPAGPRWLLILTSLDYLLMTAAFVAAWRTFGARRSMLALAFLGLNFFARFDWIGGSLLRWDWIAAVILAVSAYASGRGTVAGLCLGYATLARIFPGVFFVPLAIKWVVGRLRGTADRTLDSCLAAGIGLVFLATAMVITFGESRSHAAEFVSKIQAHAADQAVNAIGLRSVLALGRAPWRVTPEGTPYVAGPELEKAQPPRYLMPLLAAGCLLLLAPLIVRVPPAESLLYAVPLIYCGLSLSGYYYSFLVLLVLLPADRNGQVQRIGLVETALLLCVTAVAYAFELADAAMLPLFYRASALLGVFLAIWIALEYVRCPAERVEVGPDCRALSGASPR